jgi:glycosyltransferase 2 family protein
MALGRTKMFAKIGLGIAALVVAIHVLDWRAIWGVAEQLTIAAVLLVLIIIILEFFFLAWRWYLIVRQESSEPARHHFESYFIAAYLGAFTPGHVGTDAYRFVSMRTQGMRTSLILAMLLRERLLGLVGYLLLLAITAFIALYIDDRIPAEGRGFLLLCAALSSLGVAAVVGGRYVVYLLPLISIRRVQSYLSEIPKLIDLAFRFDGLPEAAKLLSLTIIGDASLWVLAFYIVAVGIGVHISFFLIGAVVVIVELLRLIPVTVQGIGVREAAFAALFALVGQDPASGFVISAVCFVLLNVATLVVGLAGYALAFNNRRIAQTAMGDG